MGAVDIEPGTLGSTHCLERTNYVRRVCAKVASVRIDGNHYVKLVAGKPLQNPIFERLAPFPAGVHILYQSSAP